MKKIDSKQNKSIKWLTKIMDDSSYRKITGLFACQTKKIVDTLLLAKNQLSAIFFNNDFYEKNKKFCEKYFAISSVLTNEVYNYASNYKNDDGIIAVFKINNNEVNLTAHLNNPKCNYLALCNIQSPNNLGAIIRSACAFNISGIFLIGQNVDIYNNEVIRSSAGYISNIPITKYNNFEYFLSVMKQKKIKTIATVLDESASKLEEYIPKDSACFVVGNEGNGLDSQIISNCDKRMCISSARGTESLNVACAVGIISFYLKYENNKNK